MKIKSKTTDAIIKSNEREHFITTLCNNVVGEQTNTLPTHPFACNRRHLFVAFRCYNFVYSNNLNIICGVNLFFVSTFENLFKFFFRKCFLGWVMCFLMYKTDANSYRIVSIMANSGFASSCLVNLPFATPCTDGVKKEYNHTVTQAILYRQMAPIQSWLTRCFFCKTNFGRQRKTNCVFLLFIGNTSILNKWNNHTNASCKTFCHLMTWMT